MNTVALKQTDDTNVAPQDAPMVAMIERIAMDPSIPIDRLEQMLAMKERMEDRARDDEDREARRAYFSAMSFCQSELPVISRNRANDHTRSRYADLAQIETQAMPIIHGHGFSVSFQPKGADGQNNLLVQWTVAHADGHVETDTAAFPLDAAGSQGKSNKTGIQAMGSTATYARRYLLCMLFNISTGDDVDGNSRGNTDTITEDQFRCLSDLMEQAGGDEAKFLKFFKVDALPELPMARYGEAEAMLKAKLAKKGGA